MRFRTAEDAKRWLSNKGGWWRQQRLSGSVLVIASVKGVERQSASTGETDETIEAALITAVNELAEATANLA